MDDGNGDSAAAAALAGDVYTVKISAYPRIFRVESRLRCSVDVRIRTCTEPVPLKYGKLAAKYPRIYGHFLQ